MSRARATLCAALLAVLAAAVYVGALHSPFVYDDWQAIARNLSIRDWRNWRWVLAGSGRPLTNYSYALNWAISGAAPFGFHLTNVLIHALNVVLLFRLTSSRPAVGLAAAGLLAVHPLWSESVGYLGARAGLLCATFLLLGLSALARAIAAARRRWLAAAAAAWLLGMACKETAIGLPLAYLAYDAWVAESDPAARRRRLWTFHAPLLTLALTAAITRGLYHARIEHGALFADWRHVLIQSEVIWRYLVLFVVPAGQTIRHAVPDAPAWHAWPAAVGLLALAALAFRARRRAPAAAFAAAWFFLFILPSSVVPLIERMAEHRVYEAAAGLCLLAALAMSRLPRAARAPAQIALLAALSLATLARNRVWASPLRLWDEAVRASPQDWGPHYALGDAWREAGDCARADGEYQRAIALRPTESRPHINRAICLAQLGRDDDAERELRASLALFPRSATVLHDLGTLALGRDRVDEARKWFEAALAVDPDYAPARAALADLESRR
jgi:MYXO-CTERM domain-containing protein